jgi:hypothetical protein
MFRTPLCWLILAALFTSPLSHAGQPIFSEMPRWSNGWGVQAVQEFRHQQKILSDGTEQATTSHILNLDGVYTWKRWIRVTAKVPMVLSALRDGEDRERGLGAVTVALPLKQYFNLDGRSGSWTFAPQVRTPSMVKTLWNRPMQHGWSFGRPTGSSSAAAPPSGETLKTRHSNRIRISTSVPIYMPLAHLGI